MFFSDRVGIGARRRSMTFERGKAGSLRHGNRGAAAPVSRRLLLRAAAAAGIAAPLGLAGRRVRAAGETAAGKPVKLAWNTDAVCSTPVAVAPHKGFFARHGLAVEFVNFAGST